MFDKNKNTEKLKDTHPAIFHQIWGVIFFALGTYFLIAIINNYVNSNYPLFGEYLGTHFAVGIKALFGDVMQFLFVPLSFYIGIKWMTDKPLNTRIVLSAFLYLLFLCTAFAIPKLPIIEFSPKIAGGNLLGCAVAKFVIYPIFGKAVFGAYFILILAMIVTTMYMFKIDIVEIINKLKEFISAKLKKKDYELPDTELIDFSEPQIQPQEPLYQPQTAQTENIVQQTPQYQPKNEESLPMRIDDIEIENAENEEEVGLPVAYIRPNPSVLPDFVIAGQSDNKKRNSEISEQLVGILEEFGVKDCKVVEINPGPIVTLFEVEPGSGIKISQFENLEKDIGIRVGGKLVRIDTIPDKTTIGIEIPNEKREIVYFKEILQSPTFQNSKMKLPVIIGKGTTGEPLVEDIAKMPHVLIAGQTGSGKSVGINSFIASLLFSRTPEELRIIMIDPKKVEMACYEGIPHLAAPVVTEVEHAVKALEGAVKEMMHRYDLLKKVGSKNMDSFNEKFDNGTLKSLVKDGVLDESENKKMCSIVIVIDELADLMMTAGKEVEKYIQRIAQLSRAVGIHLVVATQRPDTKVITGNIKANLPSRVAFRVMSYIDSRTILDSKGAEQLLGNGDMLYLKNGAPKIVRYHGAFISEQDVENLVRDIKKQGYKCEPMPSFEIKDDEFEGSDMELNDEDYDYIKSENAGKLTGKKYGNRDDKFEEAARMVVISKYAATSNFQRHLNVGFSRGGRIMDELQKAGIVGAQEAPGKPRKVLVSEAELEDVLERLSGENENKYYTEEEE